MIVLASRYTNPENRKLEAAKAAHARDLESLLELLAAYLKHRRPGHSPRTLQAYGNAIKRYLEFTKDPRVELVKAGINDLERFRDDLRRIKEPPKREHKRLKARGTQPLEKPLAVNTQNQYLAGIAALYAALVWARAMAENPVREVVRPRSKTKAHEQFRAFSGEEMNLLLVVPSQTYPEDLVRARRDTAILALGLLAGLRVSEIVGLELDDFGSKALTVQGKGGKQRQVPVGSLLSPILKAWLEVRPPGSSALIVSLSKRNYAMNLTRQHVWVIVDFYFNLLQVERRDQVGGVHALRRAAGTNLYRATRDLHVVGGVLGHRVQPRACLMRSWVRI